jgi:FkbM family methyltransferase
MKKFIISLVQFPFVLMNRIRINNKSALLILTNRVYNDEEKIIQSKSAYFKTIAERGIDQGLKVVTFLNAVLDKSNLAKQYCKELLNNFPLYVSQLGQDCLVDVLFNKKTGGVFVEIGVGDGKSLSNTYFLEKNRNWTGVLCEPSTRFHGSIKSIRSAQLVTNAVFDKTGEELSFAEVQGAGELSTLSDFKHSDGHNRENIKEYKVSTISFNDLYDRYFGGKTIDYMSIDTEGSEMVILEAIDFRKTEISVISIEHNYDKKKQKELTELLGKYGYEEVLPNVFEFDMIFAKKGDIENFAMTANAN